MQKVEHIGIAVSNLEQSERLFSTLFQTSVYKRELVESERVLTSFMQVGSTKIELLQGTDTESVITKFIEKKGEGMHHVAFEVEDIHLEMKRLQEEGFTLLQTQPKKGADNKWVCFIHPKTTNGVLVEICQEIKE